MFEKASRMKLRFVSGRGGITTEDLWDLSLPQLNVMAKNLNAQLKAAEQEDFLQEAKPANTELKLAFEIVLHILNVKKAEKDARSAAAETAEKKQKLLALLAEKQDAGLRNLSEEELRARIKAADEELKAQIAAL